MVFITVIKDDKTSNPNVQFGRLFTASSTSSCGLTIQGYVWFDIVSSLRFLEQSQTIFQLSFRLFPKNYRLENILYFVYLATGRARIYGPVAWNTIRALFSMIKIIASLSVLQQGSLRQICGITIGIIGCGEI